MNNQLLPWLKPPLNSQVLCAVTVVGIGIASPAQAQIIPDNTLGIESSTVESVMLNGMPSEKIQGGAIRDSLLFHSFQEFNIDEGYGAYFFNPDDISTIFSRVTGSNPSNLLGTLGVLGSADLIFLNPNGVLFGPNSQLDIEGSFTTTTANEIVFPGGAVFSAVTPEVPSLIENNLVAPIGLVFEGQTLAPIVSQGNLSAGQNLTLLAHTINAQGELSAGNNLTLQAEDTVQLQDNVEQPFFAMAGNVLEIIGKQQVDIFALNHPESVLASGGDMTLRSAMPVLGDAHYAVGGSFRIEDLAGELAPLISEVDPIIASANDVMLGDYTGASLHILAGGQVMAGNITITGVDATATSIGPNAPAPYNQATFREIVLSDNETTVSIDGSAQPTLDIRAGIDWETLLAGGSGNTNLFSIVNPNPTFGTTATSADINLEGNIRIIAPDGLVYLSNQYAPNADLVEGDIQINDIITESAIGPGGNIIIDSRDNLTALGSVSSRSAIDDAGTILIIAQDAVSLLNNTNNNIFATNIFGFGNGGDIDIRTDSLLIKDGFQIQANTFGPGQAGNITINASDLVEIDGVNINGSPSELISGVSQGATANGGRIDLLTQTLSLTNGGRIRTITFGQGEAGDINITADRILANESPILTTTFGQEDTGDITIAANELVLENRGAVFTATNGEGDAGDITIIAADKILVENGGFVSSSQFEIGAIGNSGDIQLTTQELTLDNGGQLFTFTEGAGRAGDIYIRDTETVVLNNESGINSTTGFNGTGGSGGIFMENIGSLFLDNGSQLASGVFGVGNAGIVSIDARDIVYLNNGSLLSSDVATGGIGNTNRVQINTNSLELRNGAQISAGHNGQTGTAGDVVIQANNAVILDGIDNSDGLPSGILSSLGPNVQAGEGGNIEITAPVLSLTNGAVIDSATFGQGNAGDILINAQESVSLSGNGSIQNASRIRSSVAFGASGNGGNIEIETASLSVTQGSSLISGTGGQGDGGDIRIVAQNQVIFDGQALLQSEEIPAELLPLFEVVTSASIASGVDTSLLATAVPSVAGTIVSPRAVGDAGDIDIKVVNGSLLVSNGAGLSSGTSGQGDGGDISVTAKDRILLRGTGINGLSSSIFSGGLIATQNTGGNINLSAMSLILDDRASLNANNSGQGNGGDLNIYDTSFVKLDSQSAITSLTTSGSGGNITFRNVDLLLLRRGAAVSTEAGTSLEAGSNTSGGGTGGNITADIDFIFAVPSENSDIIANAFDGDGGNIFIVTEGISGLEFRPALTQFSDITASSQFGVDGTVTIDTPGIDFARGFNPLPDAPRGTDITDSCDVSENQDAVELFDIGQGGSITGPEDALTTDNFVEVPWLSIAPLTSNTTGNPHGNHRPNIRQTSQNRHISSSGTFPRQLITTCQQQ